jgi:hypothetical protein
MTNPQYQPNRSQEVEIPPGLMKLAKALCRANEELVKFNQALDKLEASLEKLNEPTGQLPDRK